MKKGRKEGRNLPAHEDQWPFHLLEESCEETTKRNNQKKKQKMRASSGIIQRIAVFTLREQHQQSDVCRRFATSVYDALVDIHVIDSKGVRHGLRGIEGQNVADLFNENLDVLGRHAVAASPEGRGKVEAHVKIPSQLFDRIPGYSGDEEGQSCLGEVADPSSVDDHSRLGSRIVLDKSLDGVTVSVGDIYPWKTL